MTHVAIDGRLRRRHETESQHSKRMETFTPPPRRHRETVCGKVLHEKWVSKVGPAECGECWPTLDHLISSVAGMPSVVDKLGRKLKVARGRK